MAAVGNLKPGESWGEYDLKWYGKGYYTGEVYSPYFDFPRHDIVFKLIAGMLRPHSILDVGCAYGYVMARCQAIGIHVVGMDVSQWCGEKTAIPGYYVRGSGWKLPFRDNAFDLLYCEGVLEHIPEEYIEELMREFCRVSDRRLLFLSVDHPETEYHLCNHNMQWWFDRMPLGTFLGASGASSDAEDNWLVKVTT